MSVEARHSDAVTVHTGRPGFEGANIHTWIGFKHFMYQLEEATLEYCRQHALGFSLGRDRMKAVGKLLRQECRG